VVKQRIELNVDASMLNLRVSVNMPTNY
jgi:hypothetical protein